MRTIALVVDDFTPAAMIASAAVKRYMHANKPGVYSKMISTVASFSEEKASQSALLAVEDLEEGTVQHFNKTEAAMDFFRENHPRIKVIVMDREIDRGGPAGEDIKGEDVLEKMARFLMDSGIPQEEWPYLIPNSATNNQVLVDTALQAGWHSDLILEELSFKSGEKSRLSHSPGFYPHSAPVTSVNTAAASPASTPTMPMRALQQSAVQIVGLRTFYAGPFSGRRVLMDSAASAASPIGSAADIDVFSPLLHTQAESAADASAMRSEVGSHREPMATAVGEEREIMPSPVPPTPRGSGRP